LRPGGRIRPHLPVADVNNTTINERTWGQGQERPGDGVATLFLEGDFCQIFGRGGRIEVVICDRVGELDRTAANLNNTTINECTRGRGMPWRHCFWKGISVGVIVRGRFFRLVFFLYRRVLYNTNPFHYSFGFCHASTVGLHTGLHNVLILPGFGYTF